MEPFRVHVADEVLDNLQARLRHTRWPDQVPGIGWKQGTELDWLQHLISVDRSIVVVAFIGDRPG